MEDIPSSSNLGELPGRIRKRRFSTARIQPTRIKKVMQSDEDIGRMIASVPVAVGSAMEHFAERLLDTAANVMHGTLNKTLSPHHIQQAIRQTPYFAFLAPIVAGAEDPGQQPQPVSTHSMCPSSSAAYPVQAPGYGYPVPPTNGNPYGVYPPVMSPIEMAPPLQRLATVDPQKVDIKAMMQATAHSHLAANALKAAEQRQRRPRAAHAAAAVNASASAPAPPVVKAKRAPAPAAETLPLLDEFGNPVKRKRGRPRKDEKERILAAQAAAAAAQTAAQVPEPQPLLPAPVAELKQAPKTPTSPSKAPPPPSDLPSAPANIINGVDRDRELMPPPALPIRAFNNASSTASTTSTSTISSPSLVVSSKQQSSSADAISA
uniref:CBFD_NFYB_HMF domain-containing protein n=1 Tax=Panagrellus redivivus TaxID=6233 RepID=A0A7E4V746_PANRE